MRPKTPLAHRRFELQYGRFGIGDAEKVEHQRTIVGEDSLVLGVGKLALDLFELDRDACRLLLLVREQLLEVVVRMNVSWPVIERIASESRLNAERIHGGVEQSNQPAPPTPLDGASC